MDVRNDEIEDFDIISNTISSPHSTLASKLLLKLTFNWTTLALFVMRPETFAFITALIVVFCLSHTFDLWSTVLTERLSRTSWLRFLVSVKNPTDSSVAAALFSTGLDDKYEVRGARVGIFAVRGRRGKMEDMFDYVNHTEGLGVELYGVFDGHGSEVSVVVF